MDIKDNTFSDNPYILVVESNPDEMFKISESLKRDGFRLIGAIDGEAAVENLEREVPDMVILDIHLSGGDGDMILDKIRGDDRTKGVKVIAMTASGEESRVLEGGADAILKKPVEMESLLSTVKSILNR